MSAEIRYGVIGCGLIGTRRAEFIPKGSMLAACYDTHPQRAQECVEKNKARFPAAKACTNLEEFFAQNLDAVFIATLNASLVDLAKKCLERGCHVLVEKPAARGIAELNTIQVPAGRVFKVGFNHRYHPAYLDIRSELAARPRDPIMYIRARYGNGARVGFEKEWRSSVELAGGGELLDQGVHVIDLAQALTGPLTVRNSWVQTHYWKMSVDDNAWAVCSGPQGETFQFHVSSSEWKNEFAFEVYTRERKYAWNGLGRSYGPEKLTIFGMKPEMGPPDVETREYPQEDRSWLLENENFSSAILGREKAWGTFDDAKLSLSVVEAVYAYSENEQKGLGLQPCQRWKP